MYTPQDHTFAVCAYGESPYLEECILSLKEQTLSTNILLATSTPNELIQSLCEKYDIQMYVNPGPGGIDGDWNFAVSVCTTPLVKTLDQTSLKASARSPWSTHLSILGLQTPKKFKS